MAIKKTSKLTTQARKKSPALTTNRSKAAAKATKATARSKATKKKLEELKDRKKLMELTLKAFQMTYEDYQRGEFHRIF
jgi:hypothetical protein